LDKLPPAEPAYKILIAPRLLIHFISLLFFIQTSLIIHFYLRKANLLSHHPDKDSENIRSRFLLIRHNFLFGCELYLKS